MQKSVLITEFMDPAAVSRLSDTYAVHYDPKLVDQRAELLRRCQTIDAIIVRNRTRVDAELLQAAPQLGVVGRLGVGLDNIDLNACKERGIQVFPATGANAQAVAEYVVCALMMLMRGAYHSTEAVSRGAWPRGELSSGREIAGKRLGIVGFGSIGRLVGGLAAALQMEIHAYDPTLAAGDPAWQTGVTRHATLESLAGAVDAITLHVPLLPSTRHLVNTQMLARMKAGAVLVNTSRGGVADERAVCDALRSGHLGGAAFDVFATEPVPDTDWLQGVPNLILTPHIGGVTQEANQRVSALIATRVADALAQ